MQEGGQIFQGFCSLIILCDVPVDGRGHQIMQISGAFDKASSIMMCIIIIIIIIVVVVVVVILLLLLLLLIIIIYLIYISLISLT